MVEQVFINHPTGTTQEMLDRGMYNAAWNEAQINRHNMDIPRFMQLHFKDTPWQAIVVSPRDSAMFYTPDSKSVDEPTYSWPVWNREHFTLDDLKEMVMFPVGDNPDKVNNPYTPDRYSPVAGQPHVVVINDPPDMNSRLGENYYLQLRQIFALNPDVKIYLHGTRSFRLLFSDNTFWAGTVDVGSLANRSSLVLPSGTVIPKSKLSERRFHSWIHTLGYSVEDLRDGSWRNRLNYMLDAVLWAHANYASNVDFKTRVSKGDEVPDIDTPGATYENVPQTKKKNGIHGATLMAAGDGIICDQCSVAPKCKFFREGAVCAMPSRDASDLAKKFKTRDSSVIIDGLSEIVALQTQRAEKAMKAEEATGDLDPEVNKMLNSVFTNGTKLAQLIDPKLKAGTTVNVGVAVNGQPGAIGAGPLGTPQQFIAGAVRELESRGIRREEITPEMIEGLLTGMANRGVAERVIEGSVIEIESGEGR